MIHQPPEKLARAVDRAARLRATGVGWHEIAQELGRPVGTVRHWPFAYREHWDQLMAMYQRSIASEAASEAIGVLRVLLRSDNDRIRCDAAKKILDARGPVPPPAEAPPPTDLNRFAEYLEGLTDEDLLSVLGAKDARDPGGA
jgi:hypothetical protein